jgi:hypothetical protein
MTDIADIQLEIKAVKFALKSFARFRDEEQRKDHLRSQFDTVQNLDIYFGFSEDKLQDALNKLQDALNKLQEKENLLLTQQQGNRNYFVMLNLLDLCPLSFRSKCCGLYCSQECTSDSCYGRQLFVPAQYRGFSCRCEG